jgi:hypothetical protein
MDKINRVKCWLKGYYIGRVRLGVSHKLAANYAHLRVKTFFDL